MTPLREKNSWHTFVRATGGPIFLFKFLQDAFWFKNDQADENYF